MRLLGSPFRGSLLQVSLHAAWALVLCVPLCPHCCSPTPLLCSSLFFSGLFPLSCWWGAPAPRGVRLGALGASCCLSPRSSGQPRRSGPAGTASCRAAMRGTRREQGADLRPPHGTQGRCAFHFVTGARSWVGFTLPAAPHLPLGDVNKRSPGPAACRRGAHVGCALQEPGSAGGVVFLISLINYHCEDLRLLF